MTMQATVGPRAVLRTEGRIVGICTWFLRVEGGPVERYLEGDPEASREAEYAAKHARKVAHGRMVAAARAAEKRNPHTCDPESKIDAESTKRQNKILRQLLWRIY